MFADLFARLKCAPDFDGNPFNELFVTIMLVWVEYNPDACVDWTAWGVLHCRVQAR